MISPRDALTPRTRTRWILYLAVGLVAIAVGYVATPKQNEAVAGQYAVTWGATDTAASMSTKATQSFHVTFTNNGTETWNRAGSDKVGIGYHWKNGACPGGTNAIWSGYRTPLTTDVSPNQTVTNFSAQVTAPSVAGTYCLQYDVVKNGVLWFSEGGASTLNRTVTVTAGGTPPTQFDVMWGLTNTSSSMGAGSTRSFNVTFTNSGKWNWPAGGSTRVSVGYHWKTGACPGGGNAVWSGFRTPLLGDVPPGKTVTNFPAQVTAPTKTGTYCLQYDIVQNGVAWFSEEGAPALNRTVNVTATTASPTPTLPGSSPTATASPTKTPTTATPTPTQTSGPGTATPTSSASATPTSVPANAFTLTFNGAPTSPLPVSQIPDYARLDVQFHLREHNNNYIAESMQAVHGADCAAPPATHLVNTPDASVFNCANHLMTAIDSDNTGYGVIYLTPSALLDCSSGNCSVQFELSTEKMSRRDWWDVLLTPWANNMTLPLRSDLSDGVDLQGPPRNMVQVTTDNSQGAPVLHIIKNGSESDYGSGEGSPALGDGIAGNVNQSMTRQTFKLTISGGNHIRFERLASATAPALVYQDASNFPMTLTSDMVVQLGHHSYTPTKLDSGVPGTWHWDNLVLTPATPFTLIHAQEEYTRGGVVHFDGPTPANAYLRFSGICKVKVDGVTVNPQIPTNHAEHFNSYFVPIAAGKTSVSISFAADDWYSSPCSVKGISVWSKAPPASAVGSGSGRLVAAVSAQSRLQSNASAFRCDIPSKDPSARESSFQTLRLQGNERDLGDSLGSKPLAVPADGSAGEASLLHQGVELVPSGASAELYDSHKPGFLEEATPPLTAFISVRFTPIFIKEGGLARSS